MFETAMLESRRSPGHHLRWFLIGGTIGLLIAILLATQFGQHLFSDRIFATLWPLGILLMAVDHATISTAIFGCVFVYGSNFVLYGLGALLISLAVSFFRSFRIFNS